MFLILMMTRMQFFELKSAQLLSISPHIIKNETRKSDMFCGQPHSHTDWTVFSLYSVLLIRSLRERANPASQFKNPSTIAVFHSVDHLLHVKAMPSLSHIFVSNASAIGRFPWVSVMLFVSVCPEVYYMESGVFIPYLCFLITTFSLPFPTVSQTCPKLLISSSWVYLLLMVYS